MPTYLIGPDTNSEHLSFYQAVSMFLSAKNKRQQMSHNSTKLYKIQKYKLKILINNANLKNKKLKK